MLKMKLSDLSMTDWSKKALSLGFVLASLILFVDVQSLGADEKVSYVYPLMSPRLSSGFGPRKHPIRKIRRHHNGIDLAAPKGAPIRAVDGGIVVFADPHKGYGKLIVVIHKNGLTSHYGHLNKISVELGAKVKPGQIIGEVGSTGMVTGPHLHFEIRRKGKPLNPERFIPGLALDGQG